MKKDRIKVDGVLYEAVEPRKRAPRRIRIDGRLYEAVDETAAPEDDKDDAAITSLVGKFKSASDKHWITRQGKLPNGKRYVGQFLDDEDIAIVYTNPSFYITNGGDRRNPLSTIIVVGFNGSGNRSKNNLTMRNIAKRLGDVFPVTPAEFKKKGMRTFATYVSPNAPASSAQLRQIEKIARNTSKNKVDVEDGKPAKASRPARRPNRPNRPRRAGGARRPIRH